jgi:hypothetical protein
MVHTFLQRDLLASLTALRELPSLRKLSLDQHEFDPEDMATLASAPWFGQLTHLDVSGGAADSGLVLCMEMEFRGLGGNLRSLRIRQHDLGDEDLRLLARSALLAQLHYLDLTGNERIRDDGIMALAASPHLRSIAELSLGGPAPITDQGVAALAQSPHLSNLRYLWLQSSRITDVGAAFLSQATSLGALERLALTSSQVTEAGAAAISNSPALPRLRVLDLGSSAYQGAIENSAAPEVREDRPDGVWFHRASPRHIGRVWVTFYGRSLSDLDLG